MTKIAYINGNFLPEDEAKVSIFDRGFLFGDGIYEAVSVFGGKLIDVEPHLARLDRSMHEIGLKASLSHAEYIDMLHELTRRNQLEEGLLYFQVTRGAAPRAFHFPPESVATTLIAFTLPMALVDRKEAKEGVKIISIPEQRWKRRDIKSIGLLPQCLGKQMAADQGCFEAIMVEDGLITEGTSSTAYIIKNNVIVTRPLSQDILPGVTRRALLLLAAEDDIEIEERGFSLEEAYAADEFCLTAASIFVMPVVHIDGKPIGSGKLGPIVKRLRELYIKEALRTAI